MFGFIPDMLLIVVGAGAVLLVGRGVEKRKARRTNPTDTAGKVS